MESEKIIAFDLTQKEWGRINENYSIFKSIFEEIGFQSEIYIEFPLKLDSLKKCNIFVILCPDSSKLRKEEINNIIEFVSEGGVLIIFSSAGGDRGRRTNLNELLHNFGLGINNDEVMDENYNLGINSYVLIDISRNKFPFNGINNMCFRCGCSLITNNSSDNVLLSNDSSDPSSSPVFIISHYMKGLIILSGSYETFRDDLKGGISFEQNKKFVYNLARHLWEFVNENKKKQVIPKISLFKNEYIEKKDDSLMKKMIENKISNIEHELAELHKENDLFKLEYKRIHENLEDQMNEFQVKYVEGFKDDIDINLDEILTNFDLKVNNLTSKLLKLEKKMEDFLSQLNEVNKRMEDMENIIGKLVFNINDLKEMGKNRNNLPISQKDPIKISRIPFQKEPINEDNSDKNNNYERSESAEEKLRVLFRLRDDLIKKYKSGEIGRDKVEENLKKIENKISYYRQILIK